MASPRDIINEVLEDLERPDFVSRAEHKFYAAIKSAHSLKYHRDLKTFSTATLSSSGQDKTFTTPSELREIRELHVFSSYTTPLGIVTPGNEISLMTPYKDSRGKREIKDYYGFKYPYTYTLNGQNVLISTPPTETVCVQILGLFWPTFSFSSTEGDYVSDSWILQEFPSLIHAYLFHSLSLLQGSAEVKQNAAQNLQTRFAEFRSVYSNESFN